jgi:hypothetical protein
MIRLVLGCAAILFAAGTAYAFAFLADPAGTDFAILHFIAHGVA